MGYSILMGSHYRCHDQDKCNLADFCRLHIDADERYGEPALVAGAVVLSPEEQHADKAKAEHDEQFPSFCDNIHVDQSQENVDENTEDQRSCLNGDMTAAAHGSGGAGNNDNTEDGGDDAEQQQNHIGFLNKIADGTTNRPHGAPPFDSTILAEFHGDVNTKMFCKNDHCVIK